MSKMKQSEETAEPQSKVVPKKLKTTKRSVRNKQESKPNSSGGNVVMVNGTKNKKRKAVPEPIKSKKSKSGENIPEVQTEAQVLLDNENNTVSSSERTKESENVKTESTKTSVPARKVLSSTTVKRQKVVLQVPKLPSVSGVLFVMGINDVGQIGMDVEVAGKKRPAELLNSIQFVDIAAGAMHSVCLTSKGEVYTFGCNDEGALGRHTEEQEDECKPTKVDIPGVVVQVSAGDSHSAALTESGQVYIWGNFRNSTGMIGLLKEGVKCVTPQRILHNVTIVSIASGIDHFVCLSKDGEVFTCGNAESGQLGRISERSCKGDSRKGFNNHLEPKPIILRSSLKPITDIWVGHYNTYVKAKDGGIYACGLNNFYQLGLPVAKDENGNPLKFMYFQPKLLDSFDINLNWQHINAGQHHTLALDGKGRVYTLGRKEYGRLGLGENCNDAEVPSLIPVLEDKNSVDISCGNLVSFAVTDNGIVYSWGFGENHQLGHGSAADVHEPTPIAGNFQNSWYAIKVSGGGQHTLIIANRKGTTNETKDNDP